MIKHETKEDLEHMIPVPTRQNIPHLQLGDLPIISSDISQRTMMKILTVTQTAPTHLHSWRHSDQERIPAGIHR